MGEGVWTLGVGWDERQLGNETKRVRVRLSLVGGTQDDDYCREAVVLRNVECDCVFQIEIEIVCSFGCRRGREARG